MLDTCRTHGSSVVIPDAKNVQVLFPPPYTTSKFQLMDSGIFASLNMRYQKFHLKRALDLLDDGREKLFVVYVLAAMRAMKKIWNELQIQIILNSCVHTKLLERYIWCRPSSSIKNEMDVSEDQQIMDQPISPRRQMSHENPLNIAGETTNCEISSNEALMESVMVDAGLTDLHLEKTDEPCEPLLVSPHSFTKLQNAHSIVRRRAFVRSTLSTDGIKSLLASQRSLCPENVWSLHWNTLYELTSWAYMWPVDVATSLVPWFPL